MVVGDPEALLEIMMLPVALPAEAGLKLAVRVALCPAGTTTGRGKLEYPNPAPVTLI
jgi:hypothetical protein